MNVERYLLWGYITEAHDALSWKYVNKDNFTREGTIQCNWISVEKISSMK